MSGDNVVFLENETTLDVPPERVLSSAAEAKLNEVIVIGTADSGEFYFASSSGDGPVLLWLLERAKAALMDRP